jgi:hypothetical protein
VEIGEKIRLLNDLKLKMQKSINTLLELDKSFQDLLYSEND